MRAIDWLKTRMPEREALLANRFLRPFAHLLHDPNIWHFNRRAVARGVAVGLFVGIVLPFPPQTLFAVLAAVPTRANVAIAALLTFVTNPLTTPAILFGAYETGAWLLHVKTSAIMETVKDASWVDQALAWLAHASLPTVLGLVVISAVSALAGYGAIQLMWRIKVGRRWTARLHRRAQRA
jgi:uncharacterized protein (DUF2062 family)